MKSFSQWSESMSSIIAGDKQTFGELGVVASQHADAIKNALLELAKIKPSAFMNIVKSINGQIRAAHGENVLSGSAGNRVVSASAAAAAAGDREDSKNQGDKT